MFIYPSSNKKVEKKHRQIIETGLTLLAQAGRPLGFCRLAILASIYLINRLSSSVLNFVSHFLVIFNISL